MEGNRIQILRACQIEQLEKGVFDTSLSELEEELQQKSQLPLYKNICSYFVQIQDFIINSLYKSTQITQHQQEKIKESSLTKIKELEDDLTKIQLQQDKKNSETIRKLKVDIQEKLEKIWQNQIDLQDKLIEAQSNLLDNQRRDTQKPGKILHIKKQLGDQQALFKEQSDLIQSKNQSISQSLEEMRSQQNIKKKIKNGENNLFCRQRY